MIFLFRFYKNIVRQDPGFNSKNLEWMEKEATRQNVEGFGRRGGLLIDEMQIQDELRVNLMSL